VPPRTAVVETEHAVPQCVVEQAVDAHAVKRYWQDLAPETKEAVLHFQDHTIAEQLHDAQASLVQSEMLCYRQGVFCRNLMAQAAMAVAIEGFGFSYQTDAEGRRTGPPVAFYAKRTFAVTENLFNFIDEELGGLLAHGRMFLGRGAWAKTLDATRAGTWRDLLRQILRLMELAIVESYLAAAAAPTSTQGTEPGIDGGTSDVANHGPAPCSSMKSSKASRRRRRGIGGASGVVGAVPSEQIENADSVAETLRKVEDHAASAGLLTTSCSTSSLPSDVSTDMDHSTNSDFSTPLARSHASSMPMEPAALRHSPRVPSACGDMSPLDRSSCSVALDREPTGAAEPEDVAWGWLHNGLSGDAARWQMVAFRLGSSDLDQARLCHMTRLPSPEQIIGVYSHVGVRNGFVEEYAMVRPTSSRARARSLDSAFLRRGHIV